MRLNLSQILFVFFLICTAPSVSAQSQNIKEALELKKQMEANSLVKNISFSGIGPTIMSGRVVDLDVNPDDPTEFFVAYASGGLWHTNNNGTTFSPVMDNSATQNIGDIAVHWNSGTIWVGTGENNASRSSYAGIGVLKSEDMGKSWTNMGLLDSQHIGRIVINPDNPNELVVGVTGHLYTKNEERGIYKTSDGGATWEQSLYINDSTGIIDLAFVPGNFNIMYAAAWEKDRKAWNFKGNGTGSGIYKSIDGGTNWTKISGTDSGFPTGENVGRIGLAVYDENTLYAVLDNQFRRSKKEIDPEKTDGLTKDMFKSMNVDTFLKLDNKELNQYLKRNGFPKKYEAENVKQLIQNGTAKPQDLASYLENPNATLVDTPVIGAEIYRSEDGGISWSKRNEKYLDDLYYSFGYYFAQVRVDPSDKNKIYTGGVPLIKSDDGGKTFVSINGDNVHVDHHALWVNPQKPGHLINGNDGGVNISYDDGANWIKNNNPAVGQFYTINIDYEKPYNVYGGLQDNGVWKGANNSVENSKWHQTGQYPWKRILGGDGMQVQIDKRNSNIVYSGFQFGNYYRLDLNEDKSTSIKPRHELGEQAYRFNWQTPIVLSSHNQDILYLGSNYLHRSLDQGDNWEIISGDLTRGGKKGNVPFGTISAISESPLKFGLIYTGSDDGLVHLSKNSGSSWDLISAELPQNLWISRVVASKHKKERVYLTLNGYRKDDFTPYIYMSNDYGNSWKNIASNIPASPVNIIIEDPENENLLFIGTDNGLYMSINQGDSWESFQSGIPGVAVHDLVIQPEAKDLLVGTHGRSIYKVNISSLQEMNKGILAKELHVFKPDNIKHSQSWGNPYSSWSKPDTPGLDIVVYSKNSATYSVKVYSSDNTVVSESVLKTDKGLNVMSFDVAFSKKGKLAYLKKNKVKLKTAKDGKTYLPIGEYGVEISSDTVSEKIYFKIE
ncbi:sialidase family protein [uncultured Eudoraea sp.]|uniref:sialidase family protein n=1 Tax=uncultured Eudoraea sp. TaxID=1035614 RepID=UPI0026198C8D|nr:sialidase family protein [uncultured Eudoraea sp.]